MQIDIGDVGEDLFQKWCSSAGLNAHKAHRDRYGWDYYVEMAVSRATGSAHDLHKGNGAFKIQVKSTRSKSASVQVELSNLLALATDPLPTFYLLLQFDSVLEDEPQAAYLVCLDNRWVEKILRRVREVTIQDTNAKLNKKKISVPFGKCDLISPLNPHGFMTKILELVDGDFSAFSKQKQDYLSTVGFEDGSTEILIQLETKEQQEQFILGTLGYREPISVTSFQAWEKRFGIRDLMPSIESTQGTIKLVVENQRTVRVMLAGPKMDPLFFDMQLYVSTIPSPSQYLPFRLNGRYFDVLIDIAKKNIKITPEIEPDEIYPFQEFQSAICFLNHVHTSGANVELAIEHDDDFLPIASLNCMLMEKVFTWEEETLTGLRTILKASSTDPNVKITHRWLYQNTEHIKKSALLMKEGIVLRSESPEFYKFLDFSIIKCVFATTLAFPNQCLILFFSADGEFRIEDKKYFYSNNVQLDHAVSGPRSDTWYKMMINSQRSVYEALDDDVLIIDNLPRWNDLV
ncbi:DUF4365 domain-containing protein [Pseudomonas anguilliseptica]|uniref:DUF4365 domain-containing protein n=1 Tax=Pseudomonas anguilliseptica TaxID=53406 RepID=UPI001F440CCC|nr:DUF4365 domain-containing protein [Pseudomonas anguilliseptica]MCE5364925.1 DUF4365 domain-containing protein [Pseudomonas anguilliseptica]